MRRTCPLAAAVAGLALTPALAQPFEPDAHTLLLAHFEDDAERADYAIGQSLFAGNGAQLVEGYHGMAVDLRGRGLTPDFAQASDDYTPRYDGWGFHSRGNVDPFQGTFECWFRVAQGDEPKLIWSHNFLNAELARSVPAEDGSRYESFGITLNKYQMKYCFPTVAGQAFKGEVNFKQVPGLSTHLSPSDWHHFAMTWSPGELVVWLDGRELLTFDMSGQLGLALVANPVRYLSMAGIVLDELRVSNTVRYRERFEPAWRDGARPAYAFAGRDDVERYAPQLIDMPVAEPPAAAGAADTISETLGRYRLTFDHGDGSLVGLSIDDRAGPPGTNGLLLHRGLEHQRLRPTAMSDYRVYDGQVYFTQQFEGQITAAHTLRPDGDALIWHVTLTNRGDGEAWLEPMLSLPATLEAVDTFFDGQEPRPQVDLPRRHDKYSVTLPFAAASGGGRYVGVGISPRFDVSDIISEWFPQNGAGVIRQGTRVALRPEESFACEFHIVSGEGAFGTLDAVSAYHARFPDLYHLRDDVPVYSYMPKTQYQVADPYPEIKRQGFAGNFWGHGPAHDKGDEFGTPEWWDNPELYDNPAYARYTRRIERLWQNLANVRELITLYHHQSYDNWYPVRRFHTCPDVTPSYIVEALWPGYTPNEDPLTMGQYYKPILDWWIINEYNTPIGAHFREATRRYVMQTQGYCVGFINDMSHAGSLYRHNDPIAQRTAGRSWSRDLGTFVRKALGRKQRYQVLEDYVINGARMTFWSDGGAFSYTLGAYSAGLAIEGAAMYTGLTGYAEYTVQARNLIGEKPFGAMTHLNDDWIGYYHDPEDFTPQTLRDYYRFNGAQLVLFCLEQGITLDPGTYMYGRQIELEAAPVMVESAVLGRQIVHGAKADAPLWVRRSGDDLDTLLIVGNDQPRAQRTDLTVFNRYFTGAPLLAPYYGGEARHEVNGETTRLRDVRVEPRDFAAFKAVALLDCPGTASATTRYAGDGLKVTVEIDLQSQQAGHLRLTDFGPVYRLAALTVNEQPVAFVPGRPLPIAAGRTALRATYRPVALAFDAEAWQAVELFKDGQTHFQIAADKGSLWVVDPGGLSKGFRLGFERGTANLLNDFLEQYDSEDGVRGNLEPAAYVDQPGDDYDGWTFVFDEVFELPHGRVRIDPGYRRIHVEGPTQGEMRRAMVVLMRMLDRKYPHVGRFHPFNYVKQPFENTDKAPIEKWCLRAPTRAFYENFSDPLFMAKPVLRQTYEPLYEAGNMNFAGRYQMRWSPTIFEPTYGEDFVYGYSGRGYAETRAQLERRASPE